MVAVVWGSPRYGALLSIGTMRVHPRRAAADPGYPRHGRNPVRRIEALLARPARIDIRRCKKFGADQCFAILTGKDEAGFTVIKR